MSLKIAAYSSPHVAYSKINEGLFYFREKEGDLRSLAVSAMEIFSSQFHRSTSSVGCWRNIHATCIDYIKEIEKIPDDVEEPIRKNLLSRIGNLIIQSKNIIEIHNLTHYLEILKKKSIDVVLVGNKRALDIVLTKFLANSVQLHVISEELARAQTALNEEPPPPESAKIQALGLITRQSERRDILLKDNTQLQTYIQKILKVGAEKNKEIHMRMEIVQEKIKSRQAFPPLLASSFIKI